jgi:acetolactate synthase-1/2/3 large subunit
VDRSADIPAVAKRLSALRHRVWAGIEGDPRTADAAAFVHGLRQALPDGAIVVCDMCVAGYWCGGYLALPGPRRLIYPLGWGTLGSGVPEAIGAASANAGPVVAVVGDAGLMYAAGDLATMRQEGLDLVVLVVNDEGYGMLRFDENDRFGRPFAADLVTPDLEQLAGAFGIPYARATIEGLEAAMRAAISLGGPQLVEVRAALYPPMTTSPRWRERSG